MRYPSMKRFANILTVSIATLVFSTMSVSSGDGSALFTINSGASLKIDQHGICRKVVNGGIDGIMVPTLTAVEWHDGQGSFLLNISDMDNVSVSSCGDFPTVDLCIGAHGACAYYDTHHNLFYVFAEDDVHTACNANYDHMGSFEYNESEIPLQRAMMLGYNSHPWLGDWYHFPRVFLNIGLYDRVMEVWRKCSLNNGIPRYHHFEPSYHQKYSLIQMMGISDYPFYLYHQIPTLPGINSPIKVGGIFPDSQGISAFALARYQRIDPADYSGYQCMGGNSSANRGCLSGQNYLASGHGDTGLAANAAVPLCHAESSLGHYLYKLGSTRPGDSAANVTAAPLDTLPASQLSDFFLHEFGGTSPTSDSLMEYLEVGGNGRFSHVPESNVCKVYFRVKNTSGDDVTVLAKYQKP